MQCDSYILIKKDCYIHVEIISQVESNHWHAWHGVMILHQFSGLRCHQHACLLSPCKLCSWGPIPHVPLYITYSV